MERILPNQKEMIMNVKRYLLAALALFVFMFFYEWLLHGLILKGMYHMTPKVWRHVEEMSGNMSKMIGFQIILSAWLTFIFTQVYKAGGASNGLRFGAYFGVFAGLLSASWYLWLPISAALAWSWFFGNIVQGLAGGWIIGSIYRK